MQETNFHSKEVLEIIGSIIKNQQEESKRELERRKMDEEKREKDLTVQKGMYNSIMSMRNELEMNVKETKELKNQFNKGLERLDNLEKNVPLSQGECDELSMLCYERACFLAEKYFYSYKNPYDGNAKFIEKQSQVSRFLKTKVNHKLKRSGKFSTIRHLDYDIVKDYFKIVDLTDKEIIRISNYKSKVIASQNNIRSFSM